MMPQTIYCDESGFTGNDLSNVDQSHFVYVGIAITSVEADEIKNRVIRDYRVNGNELKGKNLVKYAKGRRAVSDILDNVVARSQCVVMHKKYALACKLYEYLFEPVLAAKNWIFYEIGFHRFISMIVYLELRIREGNAEKLFEDFEQFMRRKDMAGLSYLFGTGPAQPEVRSLSAKVQEFCVANQQKIFEEIDFLKTLTVGRWVLDLTAACLNPVLWHWGAQFESLEVYCDDSRPLESYLKEGVFDAMIGRTDKQTFELEGHSQQVTFNLCKRIELVRSDSTPGIQIADVVSSALAHALQSRAEDYSRDWLEKFDAGGAINPNSIMPMSEGEANEKILGPSGRRNALVLEELMRRSRSGSDLLANIERFVTYASSTLTDL